MNTASRMESSSESNRIQVPGHTAKKLKKLGYKLTFRGLVTVKVNKFLVVAIGSFAWYLSSKIWACFTTIKYKITGGTAIDICCTVGII